MIHSVKAHLIALARAPAIVVALVATSCGSDPVNNPKSTQALDASSDAFVPSDSTAEAGAGACLGSDDVKIATGQTGVDLDVEIPICVKALITSGKGPADADFAQLVSTCLAKATGLSPGCADCHARFADCSADQCLTKCIADPTASQCIECRCGKTAAKNCIGEFVACSGVADDTCN